MNAEAQPWSGRGATVLGSIALLALAGLLGVWGTQTRISGAVLATGQLQVENKRQVVQHLDGGVVGAIHVSDGDRVAQNEVLISLDGADVRTELDILQGDVAELSALAARLIAERDESTSQDPNPHPDDPLFEAAFATQARLFQSRRSNFSSRSPRR